MDGVWAAVTLLSTEMLNCLLLFLPVESCLSACVVYHCQQGMQHLQVQLCHHHCPLVRRRLFHQETQVQHYHQQLECTSSRCSSRLLLVSAVRRVNMTGSCRICSGCISSLVGTCRPPGACGGWSVKVLLVCIFVHLCCCGCFWDRPGTCHVRMCLL